MDSNNKSGGIGQFLALALGAGVIVFAVVSALLIGAEKLGELALLFVSGLVLVGVIAASALPIRAYKKRDATGETHYYHDGTTHEHTETRILDGRTVAAPQLLQLPAPAQAAGFPELMRAAWLSGALAGRPADTQAPAPVDLAPVHPLDALSGDGWNGDIR